MKKLDAEICRYNAILKELGYSDWSIKVIHSCGGICMTEKQEIWLDEKYFSGIVFFLHEVAHIKYPDHSAHWGDWFTELCIRYAEKPDTLELIVEECKKYHDKGCIGCAFDIVEGNGIDIRCDAGVYRKDRMNVQEIKARLK